MPSSLAIKTLCALMLYLVTQQLSEEFPSYVDSLMSNSIELPSEGSSTPITRTGVFSCIISWRSNKASALLACSAFVWATGISLEFECGFRISFEPRPQGCSRLRLRPCGSFLSVVGYLMSDEVRTLNETFPTLTTFKGPVAPLSSFFLTQRRVTAEGFCPLVLC